MDVVAGVAAAALVVAGALVPSAAVAQDMPAYGQSAPSGDETIHGRIESVVGPYAIVVLDNRGFLDNVSLHAGTIINPRGLRLAVGMTVTITGVNAGTSLSAIEIDAPAGADEVGADYGMYASPGYGDDDGYDYGFGALYGVGLGFFAPFPVVVHPGGGTVPPAAPVRGIERPKPGHPVRKALDDPAPSEPAPPSYAMPVPPSFAIPDPPSFGIGAPGGGYRGTAQPQNRAAQPQSRGTAPAARAQAAPRSAPAARSAPASPSRSH
ncbi:MAG TPA: hypothetical protein VHT05_11670 [Candidatus Elarobacter sp.]|nr:hypothetical protein [Candidatus Elarobacter sp.]